MEEELKKNVESVPKWAQGAITYQIFVDRFYRGRSYVPEKQVEGRKYKKWLEEVNWQRGENNEFTNNDFYRGNLKGIIRKIDYLNSLGVKIVYLSPINYSTLRYDHYAVTDYKEIDPDIGTFSDLDELHKKCNSNYMHLILDIAFNHCNIDNPMYQDVLKNPTTSVYKDWFKKDQNGNVAFWFGFKDMPEFNLESAGYQNYVYGKNGVIDTFSPYVDGFRLDLAVSLCVDPMHNPNPYFFVEGIKKRANKDFPHYIVGEFWDNPDPSIVGKCIDAPTSYPITNAILKGVAYGEFSYLRDTVNEMVSKYPWENLNSFLVSLDTHDISRAITIFGHLDIMRTGLKNIWDIDSYPSRWHSDANHFDTDAFRKFELENETLTKEQYKTAITYLRLAVVIQYFLIGNPCLYYGDERGMQSFKDPFNRRCIDWNKPNDDSLFDFYHTIANLRKSFDFSTAFAPKIVACDSEIFCFTRENEKGQKLFVAVNRGNNERVMKQILENNGVSGEIYAFPYRPSESVILPKGFMIVVS